MDVEIIAIGNEILTGQIVNSNTAYISQVLEKEDYDVVCHTVLPDNHKVLKKGVAKALRRAHIVILSGGLGPTCDDITRKAVAELFNSAFHYSNKVAENLIKRFGEGLKSLEDQATVPSKAIIMENQVGTAPGFIFSEGKNTVFLLPGVPKEMELMLVHEALPYLLKHDPPKKRTAQCMFHFCNLNEVQVDRVLRELKNNHPNIDFGVYPNQGYLSVILKTRASDFNRARDSLVKPTKILKDHFNECIFQSKSGTIEEAVHDCFRMKKWSLSGAESCSGGAISSRLIGYSGASEYFLGSVVCYSNKSKIDLLGVKKETLEKYGAVSKEVVREMTQGVLNLFKSDFAYAITGIAGPLGGTEEKPVGTIWVGLRSKEKEETLKIQLYGSRQGIISTAVNKLLAQLWIFSKKG